MGTALDLFFLGRVFEAAKLALKNAAWPTVVSVTGSRADPATDCVRILRLVTDQPCPPSCEALWQTLDDTSDLIDSKLTPENVKEKAVERLRMVEILLAQKLSQVPVLYPKTVFSTHKLISGSKAFLGELDAELVDRERHDFDNGCLCLLAEAYTPSEFSFLRVAESLLRRWYYKKTGKILDGSWGRVLGALLQEYPDPRARPKELAFLDYLNGRRIEVDHPIRDAVLEDAEFTLQAIGRLVGSVKGELATPPSAPTSSTSSPAPGPGAP